MWIMFAAGALFGSISTLWVIMASVAATIP